MLPEAAARHVDPSLEPPAEFDGFRVVRPLGHGGMGQVFLGHDTILDRPVALKLISAADPGTASRERFLIEARAIARLQHPNVVGIFRVGEVLGRPYLAYEFISGQSLDRLKRPLPWQQVLEIGVGVARGLAAAHQREVLHRDIKPGNIMLTAAGEVKLLDFGLAKLLDKSPLPDAEEQAPPPFIRVAHAGSEDLEQTMEVLEATMFPDASAASARLTAAGAIMGTPLYMAPELWRSEPATAASDLYSFGLVLYELLVPRLPYEGLRASDLAQLVLSRELPPVRAACPALPQAFADLIDRCVRRRREDRCASAEEARDALEAIHALYRPFAAEPGAAPSADDDAARVVASFARVSTRGEALATRMYERLFERHPAARQLFPADLGGQQKKLMGALTITVDNLRRPEVLIPLLEDLGRRHAPYGVKPEHFGAVGEALLGALAELEGERWSDATAQAWTRAYGSIAEAMQRGLADQQSVPPQSLTVEQWAAREPAFEPPRTRYARSGDQNLAYQVLGGGPVDLVLVLGWVTHLEVAWQCPAFARFLRELASFTRLIVFDKRGVGLSDRAAEAPTTADRLADLGAVLDAAGSKSAVLFGVSESAALCALFAATHPERARALVLYGGNARMTAAPDYPHGLDPAALQMAFEHIRASWGEAVFVEQEAPSMATDESFRRWWADYLRMAAGPGAAIALLRASQDVDVRAALPSIQAPALILHRVGDQMMPIAGSRYLAAHIPGARLVELPGVDHLPFVGDAEALLREVRRFLSDEARAPQALAAP